MKNKFPRVENNFSHVEIHHPTQAFELAQMIGDANDRQRINSVRLVSSLRNTNNKSEKPHNEEPP